MLIFSFWPNLCLIWDWSFNDFYIIFPICFSCFLDTCFSHSPLFIAFLLFRRTLPDPYSTAWILWFPCLHLFGETRFFAKRHFENYQMSDNVRYRFRIDFHQFSWLVRHRFSHRFFHRFLMENGSQNGPKLIGADSHFRIIFETFSEGRYLDTFWSPFGSFLAPFCLPLPPFGVPLAPF